MPKVRVPQQDGEISISRNGDIDDPKIYTVTNGTVDVDDADVAHFVSVIDGAELANTPAKTKTDKADAPPA